jgi:hypothetical protein
MSGPLGVCVGLLGDLHGERLTFDADATHKPIQSLTAQSWALFTLWTGSTVAGWSCAIGCIRGRRGFYINGSVTLAVTSKKKGSV